MKNKMKIFLVGSLILILLGAGIASAGCPCEDLAIDKKHNSITIPTGLISKIIESGKINTKSQTGYYQWSDNDGYRGDMCVDLILFVRDKFYDQTIPWFYNVWISVDFTMGGGVRRLVTGGETGSGLHGIACIPNIGERSMFASGNDISDVTSMMLSKCWEYRGDFSTSCGHPPVFYPIYGMVYSIQIFWWPQY